MVLEEKGDSESDYEGGDWSRMRLQGLLKEKGSVGKRLGIVTLGKLKSDFRR